LVPQGGANVVYWPRLWEHERDKVGRHAGGGMAGLQGRIVGGYALTTPLGSGGMYEVYRATPAQGGGREVVVKLIPPNVARLPGFLPHFRQVTQLAERLASHAHILPLLNSGEEHGFLYLASPFVASGTLQDWILRGGRLGASDVGPFFRQLCDALTYAHSLGIIHGDVKPSNVYLYEGRHVLLGDFGLPWGVVQMDMARAGLSAEAVAFLAPEVASVQASPASDIYSAGAVLYAAVTGQLPFRASTAGDMLAAHARQPVPHLAQVAPGLAPAVLALDPVIQQAMAKRPADRFPSAAAVAQAIETAVRFPAQPPNGMNSGGAYAAPAGGPFPFGAMGGPAPLGPGFGPPAVNGAAPGSPFAAPGFGAALPPTGPVPGGLQALNFPPLRGEVDGTMDQGRIVVSQHVPPTAPTMGVPGAAGPAPYAVEPPTMRVPAPAPAPNPVAPPAALNPPPAPPPSRVPPPPPDGFPYDGGSYGPPVVPAIRIPAPEANGLARTGQQPAISLEEAGRRLATPDQQESHGRLPALGGDFGDQDGYTGAYSRPMDSDELERPFSPTELGLPRLTSPDLQEMPPSWQELVREAPRQRRGEYGGSFGASQEASAEWAVEMPDDNGENWALGVRDERGAGVPRARRPRHWVRWLMLAAMLLVISLGVLVVERPDVCPVAQCRALSTTAQQYLPFLTQATPTPATVGGQPTAINISVATNKSATALLTFKDVSQGTVSWSAATDLGWVATSPNEGTLQPGGSVDLKVTANASGISPGTYTATLTIKTAAQTVKIPVTIVVTAAG
jgi:hypothetical protein